MWPIIISMVKRSVGWTPGCNEHVVSKYYRAIMQIQWLIRVEEKGIFRDTLMEIMIQMIMLMIMMMMIYVICVMTFNHLP